MLTPLLLIPLVSIPASWSAQERAAAATITDNEIAAHFRYLSDDLLEGRGPGSRGESLAIKYVAAQYERIGLRPAGDNGSWFQKLNIVGLKSEIVSPPKFRAGEKTLVMAPPVDGIVAAGVQKDDVALADAQLVFVGYGITAPEQKWDDYKDSDVKGKVLLVVNNDPESDPNLFAGKTRLYYGRWSYKYEEAARRGAAAVIIIHTTPSAGYPWQVVQSSWGREQFELPAGSEPRITAKLWATDELARKVVALGGGDLDEMRKKAESRDFRPIALGVTLSLKLKTQLRQLETANVIGAWPGADARLSNESIVVSAHHDHLGIGTPKNGDAIYNGALDNASGVASLLSLAEAVSRAKPKRTVLFISLTMEESGLLGSQYFCEHSIRPIESIVADVNIDGINIWGRARDVVSIGLGKSSLDGVVDLAAKQQGRSVGADPLSDRGFFYRSDQFSFARVGVPSVYLRAGRNFDGHEPDWGNKRIEEFERTRYHQPSDQMDSTWDLSGAVDDLRLLSTVILRIADARERPRWNPGDEFAARRPSKN